MYRLIGTFVLCCVWLISLGQLPPANPKASKQAKRLLKYLADIQGDTVLSGQHNYSSQLNRSLDTVMAYTGRKSVIWGSDLIRSENGEEHAQDAIDEAIRQHAQGHIITLMYHMVSPSKHDTLGFSRGVKGRVDDTEWQAIISPGTAAHDSFLAKIDRTASYLKQLQRRKIPVLWRPFHEMNGVWFWYGNRPGPDGIQKLWRIMFERYTQQHGLHNLIWVWNANGPRDWPDDEAYAYADFYPGHAYVDILAADIYKGHYLPSHHDDLLALAEGRPIAIGECGVLPDPDFFTRQPQWTWFMVWSNWIWTHNTPEGVRAVYDLPQVKAIK